MIKEDDGCLMSIVCFVFGCILTSLVFCVIVVPARHEWTRDSIRAEAIEAGAGEYVVTDTATGKTEFRWKGSKHAD